MSISGDVLVLQSSKNNTRALVAKESLQRSPILQQALEDYDMCKPVQINVPSRFAEAWAELLQLEDENDAKAKRAIPSSSLVLYVQVCVLSLLSHMCRRALCLSTAYRVNMMSSGACVQASDFFSDEKGIMYACSVLANRVFNPAARPPDQLEAGRQGLAKHELSVREVCFPAVTAPHM